MTLTVSQKTKPRRRENGRRVRREAKSGPGLGLANKRAGARGGASRLLRKLFSAPPLRSRLIPALGPDCAAFARSASHRAGDKLLLRRNRLGKGLVHAGKLCDARRRFTAELLRMQRWTVCSLVVPVRS